MTAVWNEQPGSKHITYTQATRKYYGQNVPDEDAVVAYIATLPTTVVGLPISDYDAQESEEVEGDYDLTVTWSEADTPQSLAAGSSAYGFNYQAPTAHIFRALSTIGTYRDSAIFPTAAPVLQEAINVVDFGTPDCRIEGIDLQAPPETFVIRYSDVDAVITSTYQATVRGLCGKVNSTTYYGYAAGQLMLVRANGDKQGRHWNLEFGFSFIPNATNIPVGSNITVTAKDGMDLLDVLYVKKLDAVSKAALLVPAAAYVLRVFERADLAALALP